MLLHHAVGYETPVGDIFPELAKAGAYIPLTAMKVTEDHPVINGEAYRKKFPVKSKDPALAIIFDATYMKVGEEFSVPFPDYIQLFPTKEGRVLVESVDTNGDVKDAVVVVGGFGKGKAVLCGTAIGSAVFQDEKGKNKIVEKAPSEGEKNILINSIYWLGGTSFDTCPVQLFRRRRRRHIFADGHGVELRGGH